MAVFTTGSLAAIMELMAQMGLRPANLRTMIQSTVVATKMFAEKWRPAQSPRKKRSKRAFTLENSEVPSAGVATLEGESDMGACSGKFTRERLADCPSSDRQRRSWWYRGRATPGQHIAG